MSHTIAIFPGSFDPFTRGHQALVDDALRIFDKVVIGIGNNVSKAGLLRIEARKQLIEDLYADNPRVEVRIYTGLTGDFARDQHASAIIRGVRNTTDFEYERTMEATNHRLHPDIITVMLFTPAPVADIASSTVREVLAFGRIHEPLRDAAHAETFHNDAVVLLKNGWDEFRAKAGRQLEQKDLRVQRPAKLHRAGGPGRAFWTPLPRAMSSRSASST